MSDILQVAFIVSLLAGMVRIATPILFGALGELVTEQAGVLNLGVEGAMLMGAFAGFVTAYFTGSLWSGVLAAIASGALMGLLMAVMACTLKVDQTVTGLALNILSTGVTFYLYRLAFKNVSSANLPNIKIFEVWRIPLLSQIPILGEVVFSQHILTYIGLALVPVIWFFLYRTKYGLELRVMGENPRAVDMRGANVALRQYLAVIFGSMMAGLGGAFLTLASAGLFVPQISGGRGWIAIALVIFGNWNPTTILLGAMFFGLIDSFQLQLQAVGVNLPYQLLLTLPYVLTILVLVGSRGRTRAPLALGIPYMREG
jgi:general nucleoside transport system permease protein